VNKRPNILFITTDEQRFDTLGCYGNSIIHTPSLDRIANEGVRFDRCYVQNPMCMPSRMSIMTGRYPSEHGCNINCVGIPPHEQEQTMMACLHRAGYYTAAIGKMHMMPKWGPFGYDYLDLSEGQADRNNQYTDYLQAKGLAGKQNEALGEKLPFGIYTSVLPPEDTIDGFVGRRATSWLGAYDREQPFFCWVSFSNPHFPFNPPQPYDTMYDPDQIPLPPRREGELDGKPTHRQYRDERGYGAITDDQTRKMIANYYGTISLIDDQVAALLESLEQRGLLEDTLIAFTSDHGDLLGDHGLLLKSGVTFYDSCVRVPTMIRYPEAFTPGLVFADPVETIDLPATFLDVAGVEAPTTMQGRSLVGLAEGEIDDWRDDAFSEINLHILPTMHGPRSQNYRDYVAMVCTREWKYVHYPNLGLAELYDLVHDPNELTNLAEDPACADTVNAMRLRLLNRFMNNQSAFIGERTPGFNEHYDSEHRPPADLGIQAEYAPTETP